MSITELREIQDLIDSGDFGAAAELCAPHNLDFDDVEAALAAVGGAFSDDCEGE